MSTWCDEYRDIVSFYYWEPQHLGRKKDPASRYVTFDLCWEHVARMEVALNHLLNIYFAMVPFQLLNGRANWAPPDSYRFLGTVELEELGGEYGGFTQPDLLFRGSSVDCAIELKINGRVSLRQIQKYLLLQALSEPSKPLSLLVITPRAGLSAALDAGLDSSSLIASSLRHEPVPPGLFAYAALDAYEQQVDSLRVTALTYEDLADVVRELLATESPDNVIVRNVHQGLLGWLSARGLTKSPS